MVVCSVLREEATETGVLSGSRIVTVNFSVYRAWRPNAKHNGGARPGRPGRIASWAMYRRREEEEEGEEVEVEEEGGGGERVHCMRSWHTRHMRTGRTHEERMRLRWCSLSWHTWKLPASLAGHNSRKSGGSANRFYRKYSKGESWKRT